MAKKIKDKLNLGCGKDIKDEYLNVDRADLPGVDVVMDLEKFPYPFKDNTFKEVICNHVLEHLSNLCKTMEELCRICKDGALIKVRVPYFSNPQHHNDPTHKRKFTYYTFDYFTEESGFSYYSKARVEVVKRRLLFISVNSEFMKSKYSWPIDFLINLCPLIYQRFFSYILPASELHILLKVKKIKNRLY